MNHHPSIVKSTPFSGHSPLGFCLIRALRLRSALLLSLNLAVMGSLSAQNAPTRESSDPTVTLSPFEVSSTSESGYTVTDSNSALKIAIDTKDLPFSLSILSSDLLRDFATMDEVEALRLNAGVVATENFITKSQNRPFIRGTSSVRVYADGLFMNSLQTPSIAVDRVEILKGTSGSLFGLGEPGGTLNYVFKPALAKARVRVTGGLGSWSERFVDLDIGGPVSSDGKLTSRFAIRHQTGDAYTEYTNFQTKEVYARLRYAFRPDTTFQITLAESNRRTNSPSYLRWAGFGGRRNLNEEAQQAARFAPLGEDPVSSGLLNRRSNTNTPESFSDVITTIVSGDFNHKFSNRWWVRASATRTHMDRDSMITSKFVTVPVLTAGSTLAPSPTTGLPVATPTIAGDLLASPNGGFNSDNLLSEVVQFNLLGHFDFRWGSWKTVLGTDYNREVFYADRYNSSWWYETTATETSRVRPPAQRVQAVVANVLNPGAGWNLKQATPPLSTFTVPNGKFTANNQGMGYYWVNHVKLLQDMLIITASGRRDEPEVFNDSVRQISGTPVPSAGRAKQFSTTYSIGAVYNITKQLSVYANDGSTARAQFALIRDRDQVTQTLADPIEGAGGDVGFRLDLPKQRLRFSAGLFSVRQSNRVIDVSELQDDGTILRWTEQSGENQVDGFEFEVAANLTDALQINLSFAHLDSRVRRDNNTVLLGQELAQTPDKSAVLIARYSIGKGFSIGGSVNVVRDDILFITAPNVNPLNRTFVGNYAYGDVFASHTVRLRGALSLRTQLNVYNVTDKVYASEFGLSKPISYRFSTSLSW